MNMFKAVKATTIEEYFDLLPDDRRPIIEEVDRLIKDTAPSLKPHFAYNMLGYGNFKYKPSLKSSRRSDFKSSKSEMLDWPTIALASQKNYISLYVCAVENGEYLAEKNKNELGKVSVGKSCIRFKKIEDLNLDVLKKVIKLAEKNPGLQGIGVSKK